MKFAVRQNVSGLSGDLYRREQFRFRLRDQKIVSGRGRVDPEPECVALQDLHRNRHFDSNALKRLGQHRLPGPVRSVAVADDQQLDSRVVDGCASPDGKAEDPLGRELKGAGVDHRGVFTGNNSKHRVSIPLKIIGESGAGFRILKVYPSLRHRAGGAGEAGFHRGEFRSSSKGGKPAEEEQLLQCGSQAGVVHEKRSLYNDFH